MSYLVLARKWRPRRFAELVGQEHVVRALSNALDSGRVHHAFLFTGTRGVGKTTIARIFAKSLNCERGVGAEPCGECAICTAVDAGRFVDLIEIDAASNTGVDDVREVIENAQYMPSRGRYKVYLVDEVHMLSRNAFNALLKTLEEPPEHVKFLLATTDPQKLPVTVLSRCLQFNLKRLTPEQIGAQMRRILDAEGIVHDDGAIAQLARGADGSLRDGLSLLDQAIAYGAGTLGNDEVAAMLGTVDRAQVGAVLDALVAADGPGLLAAIEHLAGFAPDFSAVLDELAAHLHRLQLCQLVPSAVDDDEPLRALAGQVSAELVQLWYQMALSGRRELPLAPTPRIGFEMSLLRMLAFRPVDAGGGGGDEMLPKPSVADAPQRGRAPPMPPALVGASRAPDSGHAAAPLPASGLAAAAAAAAGLTGERSASSTRVSDTSTANTPLPPTPSSPAAPAAAAPATQGVERPAAAPRAPGMARLLCDGEHWLETITALGLKGPVRELAASSSFVSHAGGRLALSLPDALEHLRLPSLIGQLADALADALGETPRIEFVATRAVGESLHERTRRERDVRQADAERAFTSDPTVQRLMTHYDARLVADSIRPADDTTH